MTNKKDVLEFNVGNGKHTKRVCIKLDLAEEPSQDDIVNGLVKYIAIMEEIKAQSSQIQNCSDKEHTNGKPQKVGCNA